MYAKVGSGIHVHTYANSFKYTQLTKTHLLSHRYTPRHTYNSEAPRLQTPAWGPLKVSPSPNSLNFRSSFVHLLHVCNRDLRQCSDSSLQRTLYYNYVQNAGYIKFVKGLQGGTFYLYFLPPPPPTTTAI